MTERHLTILQINDLHGYLEPHPEAFRGRGKFNYRTCGGLARIASIFKRVRAERPGEVLALDNGDTFHGTFVAGQSRGEAMLPLMNALEFDAMTLHWEFAYGPAQVKKLAAGLAYPALAINIYDKESGQLVFDPSCVIERGGLRIGIVGVASNIVDKSMPPSYSEGVRFTLGNTELPGHIERLRSSEKVDLVVVLSHLGFAQDAKLAAEVPGIDALISGHTHNRLYRPVWVGSTPIIQSGCHGSFVGRLDLTVDGGKVIDARHELICVDEQIEPDAETAQRVEEAVAPHRAFLAQVVGRVQSPLDRATSLEASMDNVLLDAIAAAAGTRLAFSNGWRYGAPILPGDVTMEHLWTPDSQVRHAIFLGLRVGGQGGAQRQARERGAAGRANAAGGGQQRRRWPPGHPPRPRHRRQHRGDQALTGALLRLGGRLAAAHLLGRPCSLVRGPTGITGELFYQKHVESLQIAGLKELNPALWPGHSPLLAVPTKKALIASAQMNVIEFHTWNAHVPKTVREINKPDRVVFDLDPGEGEYWERVLEAATLVRGLLRELALASWLKTSDGKGLHGVVLLTPRDD